MSKRQLVSEFRHCPGCGSLDFRPAGTPVPGFTVNCGGRGFQQPDYAVRECSYCGLLYKYNTASPADLADYYAAVDFRKWEISGFFPTERAALKLVRTLPAGSRVFDFGCCSGRLLAPLVGRYHCFGLEINAAAAAQAASKGIHMVGPDFLNNGAKADFDAVIMVDVFEHLSAPSDVVRNLYRMLRPGGVVLLVTGNGDYPACRLDPAQFWYLRNLEHLCMLTRRHAAFLARELGARWECWQQMSHYDAPLSKRCKQTAQHFSYWQFRRRTLLSRTILPLIPRVNHARNWTVAPPYEVGRDHVLLALRKS